MIKNLMIQIGKELLKVYIINEINLNRNKELEWERWGQKVKEIYQQYKEEIVKCKDSIQQIIIKILQLQLDRIILI